MFTSYSFSNDTLNVLSTLFFFQVEPGTSRAARAPTDGWSLERPFHEEPPLLNQVQSSLLPDVPADVDDVEPVVEELRAEPDEHVVHHVPQALDTRLVDLTVVPTPVAWSTSRAGARSRGPGGWT